MGLFNPAVVEELRDHLMDIKILLLEIVATQTDWHGDADERRVLKKLKHPPK